MVLTDSNHFYLFNLCFVPAFFLSFNNQSQSLECRLNTVRCLFQPLHDHFQCQPHRSAGRPLSRVLFLSHSVRMSLTRYQLLQRHQGLRRADCTSLFYLWIFLSPGCHLDTSISNSASSRPFSISTS